MLNQTKTQEQILPVQYALNLNSFSELKRADQIPVETLSANHLVFKKIKAMMFPFLNDSEDNPLELNETACYELELRLKYLYSVTTAKGHNRLEILIQKIIDKELITYLDVLTFIILYSSDSVYLARNLTLNRFNYLIEQHASNKLEVQILRALYIDSAIYGSALMPAMNSALVKATLPEWNELKVPDYQHQEFFESLIETTPTKRLKKDSDQNPCNLTTISQDLSDKSNFNLARKKLNKKTQLLSFYTCGYERSFYSDIGAFATFNFSKLWFDPDIDQNHDLKIDKSLVFRTWEYTTKEGKKHKREYKPYKENLIGCNFSKIEELIKSSEDLCLQASVKIDSFYHITAYQFLYDNKALFSELFPEQKMFVTLDELDDSLEIYDKHVVEEGLKFELALHYNLKRNSEYVQSKKSIQFWLENEGKNDYSYYENYLHKLFVEKLLELNKSYDSIVNSTKLGRVFKGMIKLKRNEKKDKPYVFGSKKSSKVKQESKHETEESLIEENLASENNLTSSKEAEELQANVNALAEKTDIPKLLNYCASVLPTYSLTPEESLNIYMFILNNEFYSYRITDYDAVEVIAFVTGLSWIQYREYPNRPAILFPENLKKFMHDNEVNRKIKAFFKSCEEYGFDPLTVLSFMTDKRMKRKFQTLVLETKAVYPLNKSYFKYLKTNAEKTFVPEINSFFKSLKSVERKYLDVTSVAFNYDLLLEFGSRIVKTLAILEETDKELSTYLRSTQDLKTPLHSLLIDEIVGECSSVGKKEFGFLYGLNINDLEKNNCMNSIQKIENNKIIRNNKLKELDKEAWLSLK